MTEKVRLTAGELAKAHGGLCGVSIGKGPCSCLVRWVEDLQAEANKLKLEKGRFQIMTRKIADVVMVSMKEMVWDGKYERARGTMECESCRLMYSEHPKIPGLSTFYLICSGKVVKT